MKKAYSILLAVAMLLSSAVFAGAAGDEALRFDSEGDFIILHITDPQDDQNPAYDMRNLIQLAIAQAQPDLVVFTGDIVEDKRGGDSGIDDEDGREGVCVYDNNGKIIYDQTLANVKVAADAVFSIVEAAGIPFAVTQGNNDYACGIKPADWLKIYATYPHCLVMDESNDSNGRIDYNLEIRSSDAERTAFNLWLMDTGEDKVTKEQLEWYKGEATALASANGNQAVPSIAFQHINVDDIGNLFERSWLWDYGAAPSGIGLFRLNKDIAGGYFTMAIKPGKTSDEFKAWKAQGDVLGAFFGHLHTEGYSGVWKGIELGFTYGCEFAKSGPYGVRVITLHEDDVRNYDNELYIYTGSVQTDDAALVKQIDEPYPVYEGCEAKFEAFFVNTFANLKALFVGVFS